MSKREVTKEQIDAFLKGSNPMEHIIKVEYNHRDGNIAIIYRGKDGRLRLQYDKLYPFVWTTQANARTFFKGNRFQLKQKMAEYGIKCKGLRVEDSDGNIPERMKNGFRVMFYAELAQTAQHFQKFFKEAGSPIYKQKKGKLGEDNLEEDKKYVYINPVEQYLIQTGKRMFKGYDDYDELVRCQWDLETEGLDPNICAISQIGIRTNKGFEKIIVVEGEGDEKRKNEILAIDLFFQTLKSLQPDVISGHNTENFDWNFIDKRLALAGISMRAFTEGVFYGYGIYKSSQERVLKLGGETEYYYPTILWGHNLTDSLFAVRRAQAIDSNMKKANLKYVTQYAKIAKDNRVYVPGNKINTIWLDQTKTYAFNNTNGNWFKVDDIAKEKKQEDGTPYYEIVGDNEKLTNKVTGEEFEFVTGRYIVERYLLDDLWETDRIEHKYNLANFLVCKMLPCSFEKVCTCGTAAIWKYLLLAWSYEHNLAIPQFIPTKKFTGGLSRLLCVGYVDRIVKLDYNSLYPSILLSFNIATPVDIMGVFLSMLDYILSQREHFKQLKEEAGEKASKTKKQLKTIGPSNEDMRNQLLKEIALNESKKAHYNTQQLPLKVVGNGGFGAFGSGGPFPWSDIDCAEETTCIGRQMLRLMIKHFTELGYRPIVGDTDGFNFQMPKTFRYTEEHPYISTGRGRNSIEGKAYTEVEGDVCEFEDMYLHTPFNGGIKKFGLGIDEFCPATINYARKGYLDLMPDGKVKMVGNTLKSKTLPLYIESFINKNAPLLLHNKGKEFLEAYYDHIEKIYNLQIPLKEIASVGKIKISLDEYKEKCKGTNKNGNAVARQAWYELAIKDNLDVHLGDAIYYINIGKKKTESDDIKNITYYYYDGKDGEEIRYLLDDKGNYVANKRGGKINLTQHIDKCWKAYKEEHKKEFALVNRKVALDNGKTPIDELRKKYAPNILFERREYAKVHFPKAKINSELKFNCIRLPNEVFESDENTYCSAELEYNIPKYIIAFNNRIQPLFACFDTSVRKNKQNADNMLIDNPQNRKYFTDEDCKLIAGQPFQEDDQDTYEQLMTMENKEIEFWSRVEKMPPFLTECGMTWEGELEKYQVRKKKEEEAKKKKKKLLEEAEENKEDDFFV